MRPFTSFLIAPAVIAVAGIASAAVPSSAIFQTTSHDFGTVARAAKAEFRFELTNPFDQPIHIRGVKASCGCITPIVETETIAPGETGSILARFNTGSFTGKRAATITVTFDRPAYTEVQLHIKGYIRSDVVFSPGEANFGTIPAGESKSVELTIDYAGRPDWAIVGLQTSDRYIKARAEETRREQNRVTYKLGVQVLPEAPVGPLLSEVIIQTNDRNLRTVPLVVHGNVEAGIDVSPKSVEMVGGQEDSFKHVFVLKGKSPFRITEVTSDSFEVTYDASGEEQALHTLPVTLQPKDAASPTTGKIVIRTDSTAMPTIELDANYRVQ